MISAGALAVGTTGLVGCSNGGASDSSGGKKQETITVTDFDGKDVEVPANPSRIAALYGGSFSHIIFLGRGDRVAASMRTTADSPWYDVVYPELSTYDIKPVESSSAQNPNVEDLASMGIDMVYFWAGLSDARSKMENAGTPVLAANGTADSYSTSAEFVETISKVWDLFGTSLGAVDKANEWMSYLKETILYIESRTSTLKDSDRPSVYYIRNKTDGLTAFAQDSYPLIAVKVAGGRLVTEAVEVPATGSTGYATVTMEQVVAWNPQYIFMGWLDSKDCVMGNSQWATIDAVKNNRVFLSPTTMESGWAYTPELPLEMYFLAKTLHPELFGDLDLVSKVQDYYKRFWGRDISVVDANAMLNRQKPA